MKDKQKIFIRGRKGRGSEIVKILTELGAKPMKDSYDRDDCVYFIDHDNEIGCAPLCCEVARLVVDNYKEIELPERKWKDGDILAFNINHGVYCIGVYAVFKKYAENDTFESYILIDDEYMRFGISFPTRDYHLANEVEKEDFSKKYNYMMSHLKAAGLCLPKEVVKYSTTDDVLISKSIKARNEEK